MTRNTQALAGLNPFEIRAGLKLTLRDWFAGMARLNPFEIRAGLKHFYSGEALEPDGLNPFEIRAGLKLGMSLDCDTRSRA